MSKHREAIAVLNQQLERLQQEIQALMINREQHQTAYSSADRDLSHTYAKIESLGIAVDLLERDQALSVQRDQRGYQLHPGPVYPDTSTDEPVSPIPES